MITIKDGMNTGVSFNKGCRDVQADAPYTVLETARVCAVRPVPSHPGDDWSSSANASGAIFYGLSQRGLGQIRQDALRPRGSAVTSPRPRLTADIGGGH